MRADLCFVSLRMLHELYREHRCSLSLPMAMFFASYTEVREKSDYIYAVRGLVADGGHSLPAPDFSLPFETVYVQHAVQALTSDPRHMIETGLSHW